MPTFPGRVLFVALLAVSTGGCERAPAQRREQDAARTDRTVPAAAPAQRPAASAAPASAVPSSSAPSATSPASSASDDGNGPWPAISLRACGLTLRHPPGYFAASNRVGKDPLRVLELIEDLPGTREQLAGKGPPGEPPLTLHFASYPVARDEDPVRWLRARPGPKVPATAIRRTTIAGLPALFYHLRGGEALVDGVVLSCTGGIVEARAPFYGPDDRLRRDFARILTMIEVQHALVTNPARCTPPGLPCSSPQLSTCVDGRWLCQSLGR